VTNPCAVARPIPLLPPVITAIFPSSFFIIICRCWKVINSSDFELPVFLNLHTKNGLIQLGTTLRFVGLCPPLLATMFRTCCESRYAPE
jgi:hypothetical protein